MKAGEGAKAEAEATRAREQAAANFMVKSFKARYEAIESLPTTHVTTEVEGFEGYVSGFFSL